MGKAKRFKAMRKKVREAYPYHYQEVRQKQADGSVRLAGQKGLYRRLKQIDRERREGVRAAEEILIKEGPKGVERRRRARKLAK